MTEEQENKKNPPEKERSWGQATTDVIGNMVDSLASGGRVSNVLGAGLQAGLNTDSFRAKKSLLSRAYAAEQRASESHNMAKESHNMAKERHNMAMKMGDIDLQRKQLALDEAYRKEQMNVIMNNLQTEFNVNPAYGWNSLTSTEQQDILRSPAVQTMAQGNYIARELLRSRNDVNAWNRFKRYAENYGGKITDDGKGKYNLEIFGRNIPLNEQEGMKLHKYLQDTMMNEINVRRGISYNATKGSVIGKINSDRIKEIIPYTSGSAVKAKELVDKTIQGMTQQQRYVMFARRTLEDQFNPNVANDEKMAEAEMALAKDQAGMSILERMGFRFNPGKAGVADSTVTSIDNPNLSMSMPQFLSYLKDQDSGSKILDEQAKVMKEQFELKQKAFIYRQMRGAGNNLGAGEGQEKPISDEDNRRGFLRYGSNAWAKMTPEVKKQVFAAEDEIANMALYYGVAENKDGKVVLKPGITQEQINEMRTIERNVFERLGLKDYYEKGFWAQMKDIPKPSEKKKMAPPAEPKKEKPKRHVLVRPDEDQRILEERAGQTMMEK